VSTSPIDAFSDLLPASHISTDEHDLCFYGQDASKEFEGRASLVLFPRSTEDVQQILRRANERSVPIVPSGGRTGYSGGATATRGEVVLSLERMRKVFSLDPVSRVLHCEAGITTEAVAEAARAVGLYYPVDFASRGSSQLGGNIATNAGGIRVVRYGSTRDWILGLTVITGRGERLDLNGPLVKNQTGYDLRSLFIGSEGTLGIVTEAYVRLTDPPPATDRALCAIDDAELAMLLMQRLRAARIDIHVIEYFERSGLELVLKAQKQLRDPFAAPHPAYLLLEVEAASPPEKFHGLLLEAMEQTDIRDVVLAQSEKQRSDLFALRERISESIRTLAVPHKNDIAVPLNQIQTFLTKLRLLTQEQFRDVAVVVFGHIGDGNLHLNYLKPDALKPKCFFEQCRAFDQEVFALVQKLQGSISAEHGVGLLKKPYLHFSRTPAEIALMRSLRAVFDPQGILNPGKLVDPSSSEGHDATPSA